MAFVYWRQVKSLLYKTYLQRKRGLGCTCCELLAPLALAFLLFVLPKIAGLDLSVVTKEDPQPFSNATMPYQVGNNLDVDPIMSQQSGYGLFRQLWGNDNGNSCWCKTLAIVGDSSTAGEFKSFMESEYTTLKSYYEDVKHESFTQSDFVPGFSGDEKDYWVQCPSWNTDPFFRVFATAGDLDTFIYASDYGNVSENRDKDSTGTDRLCGAVVFPTDAFSAAQPKIDLRFNVTWNDGADYIGSLTKINLYQDSRGLEKTTGQNSARRWYMVQGFVGVQLFVQRFLRLNHDSLKSVSSAGSRLESTVELTSWQVYPFPGYPYESNEALEFLVNMQFILLFCFSTTVALTIGRIVRERELKLREYMRMMGLSDIAYYTSWVIVLVLTWAWIAFAITAMAFVAAFKASSFLLVFFFNFFFGLASMTFSFFISSLCTRERLGSIIGFFLFFLCQAITAPNYSSDVVFNCVSLIPPSAYMMGVKTMFTLEAMGTGVTLDSLSTKIYGYSMSQAYMMLIIDIFLWYGLFYYSDQVNPFLIGYRRKWYFPFQKNFWREVVGLPHVKMEDGQRNDEKANVGDRFEKITDANLLKLEAEGKCIKTNHLSKRFGSFYAVNNLNLTMYSNEIYALLGHNGAGKTTTFSMLTGMLMPSAGSVTAFGWEIPKDMSEMRRSMGVCPQHSALWDELTVMEHLFIFGGIRGLDLVTLEPSLRSLLGEVGLGGRADFQTRALSGGMKRKLSVGIAFVGDPKIVFLDEPTSGMDPFARRSTWDLLKRKRAGRVICLTTHYMDEADVLGDRIAIMANGKLECSGTSMFLKKMYGCGYLLSFVKTSADEASTGKILNFLKSHLSANDSIRVVSSIGRELIVEVDDDSEGFADMLEALDDGGIKAEIDVQSYGISVTNIEEVFLKVASDTHPNNKGEKGEKEEAVPTSVPEAPKFVSFWQQFKALTERRIRYGFRDRQLFFMQIFLPFIILVAGLGFLIAAVNETAPPITLSVAPLNTQSDSNFVRLTPVNATLESSIWTEYCAGTPAATTTACNLLLPTSNVFTPYDFQTVLLHNSSLPGSVDWSYAANPYFAYGEFVYYGNGASDLGDDFLGVWHNATGLHTSSLGVLGRFNAWSSQASGDVQLSIVNDPLPMTTWEVQTRDAITGTLASQMVVLAMSFLPTAIISFIVMEKEKEVKSQLLISGVSVRAYWLANFVFDSVLSVVSALVAIIVFTIYNLSIFTSSETLPGSFALLLLFGPASTAFAYAVSFIFNRQFAAQSFIAVLSIVFGNMVVLISYVLITIPESSCASCQSAGTLIQSIGRFVPAFALGSGLYRLTNYVTQFNLDLTSSDLFGGCKDGVSWGTLACFAGIGDDLFYLGITTLLYLGIALLIDEVMSIPMLRNAFVVRSSTKDAEDDGGGISPRSGQPLEDQDVIEEKLRVAKLDKSSQMLFVNRAQKVFARAGTAGTALWAKLTGNVKLHESTLVKAVQSVSFAADKGQVFGLLGVNGAGKTTTFKMLCGLYCPSGGEIYIQGLDASKKMAQVRRIVGYCPQFDALWDLLTTKEHVLLYAKLRGYSGAALHQVVDSKLNELDLVQYANSRAGSLSGGNKRKLSVAMALVGEPQLVFLDEPSCGMDPFARRNMWNIIESVADKRKQSVIILTTHSMEEAEALCGRIAIQVDGRFRCLGSCQEIKNRYGDGFELNIRAKTTHEKSVEEILKEWEVPLASTDAVLTTANVMKICQKEQGRSERFNHHSFGLKKGFTADKMHVNATEFANWVYSDIIFGKIVSFLIKEFGSDNFDVIELHGLTIKIKINKLTLGNTFKKLKQSKEAIGIDDYQISQTSLEQIFNRFAATAMNRED